MTLWKNLVVALVAAFALAACSSSSDTAAPTPPDPGPSAYETADAAIAAATTGAAAQAAYDAVKDDVTAAEGTRLQAAVDARVAALAMMGRAETQKAALMNAAGMIDTSDLSTAADIAAASSAIAALKTALAAAADVSDADKAMYQGRVTAAEDAVAMAQGRLDHAAQTMALSEAVAALQAIDLSGLSDQAKIDAAGAAIAALRAALAAATELNDAEKTAAMTELATASRIVMAAQGSVDTEGQMMMLSDAVAALEGIDFDNLMTQAQIDAANEAITALDLALAAATNLTDAQKLNATVDVTVAKRKVERAETMLTENVGDQRMALTEAGTALAGIDLDDLSDQAKIDAAQAAVDALKMALDGATHLSDSERAMYQSQLDTATETVRVAQTGMDLDERMTAQRTTIMNAATMASTAVTGVNDKSTDSEVEAADAAVQAVKDAIDAADDLSENDTEIISAKAVLGVIEPQLAAKKTSRTTYLAKADEEKGKANAALGKAMHAALAGTTADANDNALANIATPTISPTTGDLTVNAALGAGSFEDTVDPDGVTGEILEAGDSAGALGSWNGTNYAHTDTGTKVVNEARVYTNQGPAKTVSFAVRGNNLATANAGSAPAFTAIKGYLTVAQAGAIDDRADITKVMADAFTHPGAQDHALNSDTGIFTARGTYDGAPGVYRCTGPCSSTNDDGEGSPSGLGGTWHFKPDAGANAMARMPDGTYLYYGWWVSKDKDGDPTAASAFVGVFGDTEGVIQGGNTDLASNPNALGGSATYAGHAAGKFAMSNALDGTGSGGHFTADATLTAKFDTTDTGGVSGTLDNFMANDESVPWSVALHRAPWGDDVGSFESTSVPTNTTAEGTTWSVNGNSAPESGSWSGQMYDELPGNTDDAVPGDGSNVPTTVTGTFYSEFSSIGRMVGAFGADKQ